MTDREKNINLLKPEATKYPTMEAIQKIKTPEQIGCNMAHKIGKKRKKITVQKEQKIFKELEEELHYKLVYITEKKLAFKNMVLNKILYIHKDRRAYESYDESSFVYEEISLELHQLLHRLFEIWGWFE